MFFMRSSAFELRIFYLEMDYLNRLSIPERSITMNKLHRIISILLTVVVMFSLIPVTASTANAAPADYGALTIGVERTVVVTDDNQIDYFSFTPKESGSYRFEFQTSLPNIYAFLYDADMQYLTGVYDDLSGSAQLSLDAGETYFLKVNSWLYSYQESFSYSISVNQLVPATGISINQGESYTAYANTRAYFSCTFEPENAVKEKHTWSSSNESVAKADDNSNIIFRFLTPGSATISVVTESGLTASCTVTVKAIPSLLPGHPQTAATDKSCPYLYYSFTPETDGLYRFNIRSDNYLYTHSSLTESDSETELQFNSGTDYSLQHRMEAGKTYYLSIYHAPADDESSVTVSVKPVKDISGMEIASPPDKTEYIEGTLMDELNLSGLKVLFRSSDGTENVWDYSYDSPWLEDGFVDVDADYDTGLITIRYLDYTLTYQLTLTENPVDHITIDSAPTKVYYYGDLNYCYRTNKDDDNGNPVYYWKSNRWYENYNNLDPEGLSFTVSYKDGTSKKFTWEDIADGKIDGYDYDFDTNDPVMHKGDNTFTLRYLNHTANITVKVNGSEIENIEIINAPDNASYAPHCGFPDWKGLTFRFCFNDGTHRDFTLDDDNWTPNLGPDSSFTVNGMQGKISKDDNGFTLRYLDAECPLDITELTENDVKIEKVHIKDFSYETGSICLDVTYADGSIESLTVREPLYQEHMGIRTYLWFGRYCHGLFWYSIQQKSETLYTVGAFGIYSDFDLTEKTILGDADGDGEVTSIDAAFIQRDLALMDMPESYNQAAGDVDGDGEVTSIDVTFIQRWLALMEVPFPIGGIMQ